ncbi:MAG: hypothetical protein QOI56_1904 [Actinomycetota bacterium]|nr:hypothetical protein [Actinomycetota bacterium]
MSSRRRVSAIVGLFVVGLGVGAFGPTHERAGDGTALEVGAPAPGAPAAVSFAEASGGLAAAAQVAAQVAVQTVALVVPPRPTNLYAGTRGPALAPAVADIPVRVYVPNSAAGTVSVIDPATFAVIDRIPVGKVPHHITPSWDLSRLFVNNTESNSLTVFEPRSGKPMETIPITDPYNLYFTPDGTKAIVVAERFQRLDVYDPSSWQQIGSVPIPWAGVDHGDFTADGRYFLASTEFSGQLVKVDTQSLEVVAHVALGGLPIDVKMSPDGAVAYVTNQGRHGVSIVDPVSMAEIGFLKTGKGAHGLNVSRDTTAMYVSNRLDGSISVIDLATRQVRATWAVGGSPDMLQVSADGSQLWVSNRYHGSVSVIDTASGAVLHTIPTGSGAHGLTLFPQPGTHSIGHNGVYR